jgi:pyruvate dehydrogenase E2 component (dihydrolipoamide acetyltransferase)
VEAEGLFVGQDGRGAATLVLLHGFGGSHLVWDGIAARFAGRCRVLAYDLPGHGGSLGFPGGTSAKSAARAILADLARRGEESAHVVGHSLGGAVAVLMAATEPARIASLTLLAPGGFGPEIDGAVLARFAHAATEDEIAATLADMSGPDVPIDLDLAGRLAGSRHRPGQIAALAAIADAISRGNRQGSFPPALLQGLSMPVAIAWGTADPVLPFSQTTALPSDFRLTAIPGAGHMLIEEAPDIVAALIDGQLG